MPALKHSESRTDTFLVDTNLVDSLGEHETALVLRGEDFDTLLDKGIDLEETLRHALGLAPSDELKIVIGKVKQMPRTAVDPLSKEDAIPPIYDAETGRLDAKRVARLFGVSLTFIAEVAETKLATVSKTPNAPALQDTLRLFGRIARLGFLLIGSYEGLRIWMNEPNPQLDEKNPLEAIRGGYGKAVVMLLENMLIGQPA